MVNRGHAFVICHTILHNGFRAHNYKGTTPAETTKAWMRAKFIADFICLMASDGKYIAYTSPQAFSEFEKKMSKEPNYEKYIEFLEPIITPIRIPPTDHLRQPEATVVVADLLANDNFEVILITDMRPKIDEAIATIYKKSKGQKKPVVPFIVLNSEEIIQYLVKHYNTQCKEITARSDLYGYIVKC